MRRLDAERYRLALFVFVPMFAPDEPDNWTATTSNCTTPNNCTLACADGVVGSAPQAPAQAVPGGAAK